MPGDQIIPVRSALILHGFHLHDMENQLAVLSGLRRLSIHSCTFQGSFQLFIEHQGQLADLSTLVIFVQQLLHSLCKMRILAENLDFLAKLLNSQIFCVCGRVLNLLNQSQPQLLIGFSLFTVNSAVLHPRFHFRESRYIVSQLVNGLYFRVIQRQHTKWSPNEDLAFSGQILDFPILISRNSLQMRPCGIQRIAVRLKMIGRHDFFRAREFMVKFRLILCSNYPVAPIQLGQLCKAKGQRFIEMNRSGNIGQCFTVLLDKFSGCRRRNVFSIIDNAIAFLINNGKQLFTCVRKIPNDLLPFLPQGFHFLFNLKRGVLGHVACNSINRFLHVHIRVIQHGNAQTLQAGGNFFLQDT